MMTIFLLFGFDRIPLDDGDGAATGSWNGYVNDDDRALLKAFPCPDLIFLFFHGLPVNIS